MHANEQNISVERVGKMNSINQFHIRQFAFIGMRVRHQLYVRSYMCTYTHPYIAWLAMTLCTSYECVHVDVRGLYLLL